MPFQLLINAFSLGSYYALLALGFSLIFGVTRAFNLAHGEMILLSGYLAFVLERYLHFPFIATIPLCMASSIVLALALYQLLRLVGEPVELNTLVVTFGLALVLENAMLFVFSANYRSLELTNRTFEIRALHLLVTPTQIMIIVFSLAATTILYVLLRVTFIGKALRATIQNSEAARLAGIPVQRMGLIAFGIGGAFIGLTGPLYARMTYLHPFGGIDATLTAIIVTIFAGIGRIRPVLLGGWVLGLVESATVTFFGTNWREPVIALLLITLLLTKPQGLFIGQIKTLSWRR